MIVKGTEYFDGKTSRYVDYPLTDVLQVSRQSMLSFRLLYSFSQNETWQMMGRAGRPGFDDEGIAVIMCTEDKRDFYKKV